MQTIFRFLNVGRCAAAILVFQLTAAAECTAQGNLEPSQNYSQRQPDVPVQDAKKLPEFIFVVPVIVPEQKKLDAGSYQPDCNDPKNAEDGNFCQQRRAAKAGEDAARAGEEAADVARWQFWLSLGGLLGLAGTVGLTFWAALAASRAAKSAANSASTAAETLKAFQNTAKIQLRAYITCGPVTVSNLTAGEVPVFKANFKNRGQTPASDVRLSVKIRAHPWPLTSDFFEFTEAADDQSSGTVGPDQTFMSSTNGRALSKDEINELNMGSVPLFVFGQMSYRDVYGTRQISAFRFQMVKGSIQDGSATFQASAEGNEIT